MITDMVVSFNKNYIILLAMTLCMFTGIAITVFFWSVLDGRSLSEIPAIGLVITLILILLVTIAFMVFVILKSGHYVKTLQKNQYNLEESKARFLWLYRNSPVPYFTIDAEGRIILPNLAALRLLKLDETALISKKLTEFIDSDAESDLSVLFGRLQTYVTINETEVKITVSDGGYRWVLLSVFMYGETGERLVTLVDITKQRAVDQAKSEFVSFASHQLRTPISAIRWNLELLGSDNAGGLNEKQQEYFVKINRNASRMVLLIDDFLNVSKLEMGTFATEIVEINLAVFFEEILDEFQERIETKSLVIQKNFSDDHYTIRADARLLHIVVSNIVSNAVKYTGQGGTVEFGYAGTDETTVITVKDSGLGIPASEIDKLFSKFYRASNARKNVAEGTGLGLYIVEQSVLLMGGTIDLKSKEDVGTALTVTLPI